ncbi:MAG: N-acetylmuramoyl-L-alanine amidase [Acidobacteria bacterium]|nr:N-acetylmuramoyl-L-alanine amidase [Acidobacteriota bacterium]
MSSQPLQPSQASQAPTLALLAKDGRRTLPLSVMGDQEFVPLDDLAAAFQLTVREESLDAMTVSYKGRTIVLQPAQALASVSGRLISLPAPLSRSGRRWLVPVEFISRALATIYDVKLELRKPSRLLLIGDIRVPRIVVRYDALGASGRLTIDAMPRATSTVTQDTDRLIVKFDADALDVPSPLMPLQGAQSLAQTARLLDPTTLAITLGPRFAGFKASTQPIESTLRLVIDVAAQPDAAPPPSPQPPPALPTLGQAVSLMRTIVIDPGHGGEDEGAIGGGGAKEKDVTLAVARRAKAAIEARLGLRVLLTREDDRRVALDERTALANNNKADLFVSLHAAASLRPAAAGATIFYAAFEKDAAPPPVPDRVPTFGGGVRDIELVPWELAQTRHLDQSTTFAALLEAQLHDRIPLVRQPIASAPLRVLESANMPAVLVELGYLTNDAQAARLAGDAFATAFVQALSEAIVKLRDAQTAGGTR